MRGAISFSFNKDEPFLGHSGHLNQVFVKTLLQVKRNKQRGAALSCLALNVSIYFTAALTVTVFGGGDAIQGGVHAYSPHNLISIIAFAH